MKLRTYKDMGVHFENVNMEEVVCNGDDFDLYASVDPLTFRLSFMFSLSLSFTMLFLPME